MALLLYIFKKYFSTMLSVFAVCVSCVAAAETDQTVSEGDQCQLLKRIESLESRLDALEQHLSPLLDSFDYEELLKQEEEEKALALPEILRRKHRNFTGKLLFLTDTQQLLLAYNDATLRLVDLDSGEISKKIVGFDDTVECLVPVEGSSFVYAGTRNGSVYYCDLSKGKLEKVCETGGWPVSSIAVSADGRYFAWATNGKKGWGEEWMTPDEPAHVFDAQSRTELFSVAAGRCDFQALSFSGDGNSIAIIQSEQVIIADTATGQVKQRFFDPEYGPLSVAYSPAGSVVAIGYAPHHLALWDTVSGERLKLLKGHNRWVVSLSFTMDGETLVSSAGDCTARVWDVATGNETGRLRFSDGAVYVRSVSAVWPCVAIARRGEFVVCDLSKKKK